MVLTYSLFDLSVIQTFSEEEPKALRHQNAFYTFFYSHKILQLQNLQYKSKGSMEIQNNPNTYI